MGFLPGEEEEWKDSFMGVVCVCCYLEKLGSPFGGVICALLVGCVKTLNLTVEYVFQLEAYI